MRISHRNIAAIVAMTICLTSLGLLWKHNAGAEPPRIVNGSTVTVLYQVTVPGEGLEIRLLSQFVQGRHELPPALERAVIGMKTGDKVNVELTAATGFGPYDMRKKKTVPKSELPTGTKEGDVLENRDGQQATVAQLSDGFAVVDYNHPMAGKPVVVKMRILRVDNPI